MRNWAMGLGLAAVAASTTAQEPATNWRYFEPEGQPLMAGVVNADGAQLIIKCDKPGKKSVYVVMVNSGPLVQPSRAPFILPTEVRFDDKAPQEDSWRFYENSAVAIDMRGQLALTRLMVGLPTASKLRLRMYVERGRIIEVNFDVAGAQEAMRRVYESCQDELPD